MSVRFLAILLFFCLVLSIVSIPVVKANYVNCAFSMPITVENEGSTDLTNVRVQFEISPASLVDLGMMLSDADDTYLQDGSTTLDHVAMQLSGTQNVTWTGLLSSINGNSHKEITLWMGFPAAGTRSQAWLGDVDDYTWAADSATLDLTDDFELRTTMTLFDVPSRGRPLISKKGSYELWLNPASPSYEFSVWTGTGAATSDEVGTPNYNGYDQGLTYTSNSGSEPWQLVADSSDNTWIGIQSGSPPVTVSGRSSFETTLPEGCTITVAAVDVTYRVGFGGNSGTGVATPYAYSPQHGISWGGTQAVPSAMTTYSDAIPFPGGSDVQAGILLEWRSGSPVLCSRLWLDTDVLNPGSKSTVAVAAATGTEETVLGWFDGSNIFIQAAAGQSVGTPTGALCFVNEDPVYALMVAGKFNDVSISTP